MERMKDNRQPKRYWPREKSKLRDLEEDGWASCEIQNRS